MIPGTRERKRKDRLSPEVIKERRATNAFKFAKVANCAGCGAVVTSNKYNAGKFAIEYMFGRIDDRPYCERCYRDKQTKDNMR